MEPKDAQLEAALRRAEPAIADDDFSDAVMGRLPGKRLSRATARRLTLGGAAVAGSIFTSVLGAPLETAFSSLVLDGGYAMAAVAAIVVLAAIAVPVAWVFYSR